MIASCTQRVNWALNYARLFIPPHPVNNQTTCIRSSSAINPRGNIRQRGDRLLVTCNHPFLQLLILAGTLTAQLSRFTRCYFYLPSKPCLRPFPLPGPPLLYLQPLSLLFPTLWSSSLPGENTAVIERPHGPGRLTLRNIAGPKRRAGRPKPLAAVRPCAYHHLGTQTFNYRGRFW